MNANVCLAVLVLLVGPVAAAGQGPGETAPRADLEIGVFGGVGSGPIDAAAWGVDLAVPLWRNVAATAELSGWGNGFGGTTCIASVPESYRCSVSGWAGLVGLAATVPVGGRLGAYGELSGGRFNRDGLGDERVSPAALSVKAGLAVRLHGPFHVRLGFRYMRPFDDEYRVLLGEDLEYSMGTMGFSYRLGL